MSYIGNSPTTAAFLTDTFSGTGSQTVFTMAIAPANTSSCIVAITGVLQDPSTYAVSGTTLTFSAAPPTGTSNISVRYLGIPASGVTTTAYRTVTNFTATASQTSFSVPSYTVGFIDVYRNGVRLAAADYTATTGTTVVLANAATLNDSVVTESFLVSSVLNAIPATAGAISLTSATYLSGILPEANGGTNSATMLAATKTALNASGSAPIYGCRAWVNFDGTTASPCTIRASGNVSSVTKNGTGDYTINFTTAMPDANYCGSGSCGRIFGGNAITVIAPDAAAPTTTAFRIRLVDYLGAITDAGTVSIAIFR